MAPIAPIPPTPPLAAANAAADAAALAQSTAAQAAQAGAGQASTPLATFQDFFSGAVQNASRLDAQATAQQKQLLVGNVDNLHDVFISLEKADLAFQLTMAVRDKVISAYQTVMQMSV